MVNPFQQAYYNYINNPPPPAISLFLDPPANLHNFTMRWDIDVDGNNIYVPGTTEVYATAVIDLANIDYLLGYYGGGPGGGSVTPGTPGMPSWISDITMYVTVGGVQTVYPKSTFNIPAEFGPSIYFSTQKPLEPSGNYYVPDSSSNWVGQNTTDFSPNGLFTSNSGPDGFTVSFGVDSSGHVNGGYASFFDTMYVNDLILNLRLTSVIDNGPYNPGPVVCFGENSKITCQVGGVEVQKNVQDLRIGDLVKTGYHGYVPVWNVGRSSFINPPGTERLPNKMYKLPRYNYPGSTDDLYLTGYHSVLVKELTCIQRSNLLELQDRIFVTDNHYRLAACLDSRAEPITESSNVTIYHFALEHHDRKMNYSCFANGIMVETCSIRFLSELSNMELIG